MQLQIGAARQVYRCRRLFSAELDEIQGQSVYPQIIIP